MTNISRRTCLKFAAALAGGTVSFAGASAQTGAFPSSPVRIYTESAGGAVEVLARLIGQQLTDKYDYPQTVVEPLAGADGTIAARTVAEASPDGYTLLMIGASLTTAPQTIDVSYDPMKFEPIAMSSSSPHFIFVNPKLPVNDIAELTAYLKENDASFAAGALGHLTYFEQALLWKMIGVEVNHIAYRGGSEVILGVMRGEADIGATSVGGSLDYIKDGSIRALAVTSPHRLDILPDLPAVNETVPGYSVMGWQGLFAPPRTSEEVVAKLHADVTAILGSDDVAAKIKQMGLEGPPARTRADMKAFLAADFERWANLIK